MKLILATRNPSKAEQIKIILGVLPIPVLTLTEAGIRGEVVENGSTLEENAFKKAIFAWKRPFYSASDDTGFFIDALDGAPGIYAARWAGEGLSTEDIMNFTLEKLKNVPEDKRTACFRTAAVLVSPDGTSQTFMGEAFGKILTAPVCACQPKMPYSAIFVPDGQTKVWAEMSVEEQNAISHRGKAFAKLRDHLIGSL
jgi:XTP/dITP diphosphohydrolase